MTRIKVNNNTQILTLNNFLIDNLDGAVSTDQIDPVQRWQIVQLIVKKFWRMYLEEHIVELRQARQCKYVKPNIKVVDLVFQVEKMLLLAIDS